jgi:quercetin dioxygenase-like cupin family protein
MKVIKNGEVEKIDATDNPLFFGGKVSSQPLVSGGASKDFNFGLVSFAAGARNKLHTHSSDQILFIASGTGTVATEHEEVTVHEGDTILIPAGEKHWHGARPDSAMAHIALTVPGGETKAFD